MGFKASTGDVHPGSAENPRHTQWLNGPNAGKTLAEAPRPTTFAVDHEAAEEERKARVWAGLKDVGRMQVRSRRLGLEKAALEAQIELAEMEKDYPYEFVTPGSGRPPWFYPAVIAFCMLQVVLLLVVVGHLTHPALPQNAVAATPESVEVAPAPPGRVEVARKGGPR
jgi:hypothetical protein